MADIKSTFVNVTSNLAKTSGDLVKNTKLSLELAGKEEQLKNLYVEIGKKVHEIYSFKGSLGQPFDDLYKEIVSQEAEIKELKKRLNTLKGVKSCPKCRSAVDRKNEFCPNCGNPMITSNPATPPQEGFPRQEPTDKKNAEYSNKKCPFCGAQNNGNAKFCLSCARVI